MKFIVLGVLQGACLQLGQARLGHQGGLARLSLTMKESPDPLFKESSRPLWANLPKDGCHQMFHEIAPRTAGGKISSISP